jgi:hypothetical protein
MAYPAEGENAIAVPDRGLGAARGSTFGVGDEGAQRALTMSFRIGWQRCCWRGRIGFGSGS